MKIRVEKPNVNSAAISIIKDHFQSPLKRGGKKPKKKTVQEKPTGACLVTSNSGCLRFSVEKAMLYIYSI